MTSDLIPLVVPDIAVTLKIWHVGLRETANLWVHAGLLIAVVRYFKREPLFVIRAVYHGLHRLYLPLRGVVAVLMALLGHSTLAISAYVALSLVLWWLYRNVDDDDDWHRRKKRAAQRVKALSGRLAVVHVTDGTR